MSDKPACLPYRTAHGTLYAADVARTELMGIESTRKVLGSRVVPPEDAEFVHTVMTKHGQPVAVIVDIDWYRRAREALADPTDL
jgi:hypothetical protein